MQIIKGLFSPFGIATIISLSSGDLFCLFVYFNYFNLNIVVNINHIFHLRHLLLESLEMCIMPSLLGDISTKREHIIHLALEYISSFGVFDNGQNYGLGSMGVAFVGGSDKT